MKKISCIMLIIVFAAGLFGCSSFDPVSYVDGAIKLAASGEVSEELLENSVETKSELKREYQEMYDESIDAVFETINVDEYTRDVGEEAVKKYVDACLSSMKYVVSDEYTEKNDTYYIDVEVYPPTWLESIKSYFAGEYLDEWADKISNGEYEYISESQLQIDMCNDMLSIMAEKAKNTEYGEPETIEMRVELDGDYYTINEDDFDNFCSKAFPE